MLVVVGMPGSGKSLASNVAREMKIPVFVSGDIIRAEAKLRGLSPSRRNLGDLMLRLRREEGMAAVAKRLVPLIDTRPQLCVAYEGARNIEEIDELGRRFRVVTIAIHASPRTRLQRLLKRRRGDRPRNWNEFVERDERELKVGVGKVIALANRTVENEDSKEDLKRRMKRLLSQILVSRSESVPRRKSGRLKTRKK